MTFIRTCFVIVLVTASAWSAKFPSNVEKCKVADSECIKRVSQSILLASAGSGHQGLNLPSIDPLKIDRINIQDGTGSPVSINLELMNVTMRGLSKLDVYLMNGFDNNIETPKAMKARLINGDIMSLEGDYTMNGKVLLLPIRGSGKAKINFYGWDSDWKIKTKAVEKNGKRYLTVDDSLLKFKVSHITMNFENLFNGDQKLSETMNAFLNDNWNEILTELRPSLQETISQILISIISGTFAKIPYNEIFSE